MRKISLALAMAALVGLSQMQPAQAGCLGGAVVGGVAGHVAGHHGLLGAAAGCAVGHHTARVRRDRERAAEDGYQGTNNYNTPDTYRSPRY